MRVEAEMKPTSWGYCLDAARMTVDKKKTNKGWSSQDFQHLMLLSEHSPLREVVFVVDIFDLPSWVSVHLVRHFIGVEKYVVTQREDRVNDDVPRAEKSQGALINMRLTINAQALINISQRRLCPCASLETVKVWQAVKRAIAKVPGGNTVAKYMVPQCVYRGFCPEGVEAIENCKYSITALKTMRKKYLDDLVHYKCIIGDEDD